MDFFSMAKVPYTIIATTTGLSSVDTENLIWLQLAPPDVNINSVSTLTAMNAPPITWNVLMVNPTLKNATLDWFMTNVFMVATGLIFSLRSAIQKLWLVSSAPQRYPQTVSPLNSGHTLASPFPETAIVWLLASTATRVWSPVAKARSLTSPAWPARTPSTYRTATICKPHTCA